jgi:hypothetical protein
MAGLVTGQLQFGDNPVKMIDPGASRPSPLPFKQTRRLVVARLPWFSQLLLKSTNPLAPN